MDLDFPEISTFFESIAPAVNDLPADKKERFADDLRSLGDDGLVSVWSDGGLICADVSDGVRSVCRRHGVLPQS